MLHAVKITAAALVGASLAVAATAQTALTTTQSTTHAQITTTQSQSRNGAGTSTFVGTTSFSSPTLIPISRFDTSTGILVGARMSVSIPYTMSVSATGTVPASGSGRTVDVTSNVSGSVIIAGTSITTTSFAAAPKCNSGDCLNQSSNNTDSTSGTLSGTATVATANLAALAGSGPGTVNFSTRVNATNTQIVNGSAVTTGFANTSVSLGSTTTASNVYSVSYDYLKFANPSFNSASTVRTATVNFGTRFIDSGTTSQVITLSNIGDGNTAGLAVNSITRSTNNANLTTTLTPISNIAANTGQNFAIGLNPATVGSHSDTFTINTSDYAPGGVGIRNYALTVTASATLLNHASPSFNGSTIETSKTIDFGLVSSRGGPVLQNFQLFNIGDLNSAGLELYQINGPGNSLFTSNISTFLNLAGGGSNNYSVTLNPLNLGIANGIYTFLFRDYAPGVSGGRNYTLTLNLIAQVFDPVPEPATWMSMLFGFGLVGALARRRARTAA
ncbi:PEPxxWA-CTERM sorting domain-containing protein [Sandarakinorhabdus oryzae]|uniref:PEPxxWA-CTERM sorting domain-containing protein n=1 Tax=Sandarakinorhabdus oryzae TaxID=2675220 RepID=UPI0012E16729|nr:PEPxxWA-CTERM sorting domain-containing protein [Sandarakinorhabdus oryzae]